MTLAVAAGTRIYLALEPTDMRKGFDGLAAQVSQVLRRDPFSGHLFLFRGKCGDRLKALYWDGSGLCRPFARRRQKLGRATMASADFSLGIDLRCRRPARVRPETQGDLPG